ncbi:MAG: alpha/beta fold hydrolase [Thermodesulfobacteriota bacterium]|nr:alpha/beta fold hydrolase [Thermodesulfobacteriota bacterium]
MATYVLIHGAWHGSWCWDKVVHLLKGKGHKVEAPDLPGHGKDPTPIQNVSLQAYVERVCKVLDAQSEPVVLVGHSMGGIVISQAAEYRPERIKTLIYLTAFLLQNGEFLLQIAQGDTEGLVLPNLVMAEDQSHATVKEEALKEAFYGDCSDEDVVRAKSLLVPQAAAPFATPISITEKNFGRIPRIYIECLRDRAISPSIQKRMYTALPCRRVIPMDTSHSPFFSAPETLVTHLISPEG